MRSDQEILTDFLIGFCRAMSSADPDSDSERADIAMQYAVDGARLLHVMGVDV